MDKKYKFTVILFFIIFTFLFYLPNIVNAQPTTPPPSGPSQSGVTLPDPLGMQGNPDAPQILVDKIINATLGIVGSLALVMFIYGGFVWMLAAGNKERVQKGKEILTWATIGLIVIFSAYALIRLVFTGFGVT